jgi:hypothetical protein
LLFRRIDPKAVDRRGAARCTLRHTAVTSARYCSSSKVALTLGSPISPTCSRGTMRMAGAKTRLRWCWDTCWTTLLRLPTALLRSVLRRVCCRVSRSMCLHRLRLTFSRVKVTPVTILRLIYPPCTVLHVLFAEVTPEA